MLGANLGYTKTAGEIVANLILLKIEANVLNQCEKIYCLLLKAYMETGDNTTLTQLSTRESRYLDYDDLRKVYSTVFECLQK